MFLESPGTALPQTSIGDSPAHGWGTTPLTTASSETPPGGWLWLVWIWASALGLTLPWWVLQPPNLHDPLPSSWAPGPFGALLSSYFRSKLTSPLPATPQRPLNSLQTPGQHPFCPPLSGPSLRLQVPPPSRGRTPTTIDPLAGGGGRPQLFLLLWGPNCRGVVFMPQVPAASITLYGLTLLQVTWGHWRHNYSAAEVWAGPGLSIALPPTHPYWFPEAL